MLISHRIKRVVPLLLLFLATYPGCGDEVSRIGSTPICARDLARRVSVTEIYYPGSGKNHVALSQLIKGCLSLEILLSLGHKVDDEVLEKEAKRIDANTKAPEMLGKIKDVYGVDRKSYLRSFVAMAYAERVLYSDVFLRSPDIQDVPRKQAEALIRQTVEAPSAFAQAAKQREFPVSRLRVSLKYGVVPLSETPVSTPAPHTTGLETADRLYRILENTKAGAVVPRVIEWQENFQAVRLIKRDGKDLIIESAIVPKRSYDEWFWEKASKIPVRIKNVTLKTDLLKEVSWASRLKLD